MGWQRSAVAAEGVEVGAATATSTSEKELHEVLRCGLCVLLLYVRRQPVRKVLLLLLLLLCAKVEQCRLLRDLMLRRQAATKAA